MKIVKQIKVIGLPVLVVIAAVAFIPQLRNFLFGTLAAKGDSMLGGAAPAGK